MEQMELTVESSANQIIGAGKVVILNSNKTKGVIWNVTGRNILYGNGKSKDVLQSI